MIEGQHNTLIKQIKSDNGSEFMTLTSFLLDAGIGHKTSCVYTPVDGKES